LALSIFDLLLSTSGWHEAHQQYQLEPMMTVCEYKDEYRFKELYMDTMFVICPSYVCVIP